MIDTLRIEPGNKLPKRFWTKYQLAKGWLVQSKEMACTVQMGGSDELDSLVYLVGASFNVFPTLYPFLSPSHRSSIGIAYKTLNPERIQCFGFTHKDGALDLVHLGFAMYGDKVQFSFNWKEGFGEFKMYNDTAKKLYNGRSKVTFTNPSAKWIIRPHRAIKSNSLVTLDFYSSI